MRAIGIIIFVVCHLISFNASAEITELKVENGVSLELAKYRKKTISNIHYEIEADIPEYREDEIAVVQKITFKLSELTQDLQLDFKEDQKKIKSVIVNGLKQPINHRNEHLIINKTSLEVGQNLIELEYIAGDGALNRNGDYLYTLFVPDRMRTSFIVFDQPNLKATFELSLYIPEDWAAISTAPEKRKVRRRSKTLLRFEISDKISTYLFSFVAGHFDVIEKRMGDRTFTMLHRETDKNKIKQSADEIFRLHKVAMDFMEEYTGIDYPFKKFGFALIPNFQFGGMEHVGAIQYKSRILMLDEAAPKTDLLSRAALIGHETAHMWFGDLVTMDWFNDVWTKEVFANFMAGKIVNPSFPDIDHELRAHLGRHPSAYSIDRTQGANPIRQDLDNLNEAGTLYGDIIYDKSPIMMNQLEKMLGENDFRDGLQEYLKRYAFDNATWPNLIEILDKRTQVDLKMWSDVWVNTPGRPVFSLNDVGNGQNINQNDPLMMDRIWPQNFTYFDGNKSTEIMFTKGTVSLMGKEESLFNDNGIGYGLFPIKLNFLQEKWPFLSDLQKASGIIALYEQLLENNGTVSPIEYIEFGMWAVDNEENTLVTSHLLKQLNNIYWSLLTHDQRNSIAPSFEKLLMKKLDDPVTERGKKKIYFQTLNSIALTDDTLNFIYDIWEGATEVEGLLLTEWDFINITAQLAIKRPEIADPIINQSRYRINNPDLLTRYDFIKFALYSDPAIRDEFFNEIKNLESRHTEEWVIETMRYIHHPLRQEMSEKYILPSLELLEEIQMTGDIFFPGRWLESVLRFYQSDSAANTVRTFLEERPNYNRQLKLKILQEADPLFRANNIVNTTKMAAK